jgi:hypothetical protein
VDFCLGQADIHRVTGASRVKFLAWGRRIQVLLGTMGDSPTRSTTGSQPAGFGDRHNLIAPTVSKASTGCATIGIQPEV